MATAISVTGVRSQHFFLLGSCQVVEKGRLTLPTIIDEWFESALAYPGVQLLNLTLPIIVESTKLIGFHRDPADQIIVATARIYSCPLLTVDRKILAYPNVNTLQ